MFNLSNIIAAVGAIIGAFHPNRTIQNVVQTAETVAGAVDQAATPGQTIGQTFLDLGKGHLLALAVGIFKAHGEAALRTFLMAEQKYIDQVTTAMGGDVAAEDTLFADWVQDTIDLVEGFATHTDLVVNEAPSAAVKVAKAPVSSSDSQFPARNLGA